MISKTPLEGEPNVLSMILRFLEIANHPTYFFKFNFKFSFSYLGNLIFKVKYVNLC